MTDPLLPTATVVIVNYNQPALTLACLASVAQLRYGALQVVVVDNGSTDDSVHQLRAAIPEAQLLVLPSNVGFTRANNEGCRHALGGPVPPAYLWLLNNDTLVDPQALSALVELAEAHPTTGAVASVLYDMGTERIQAYGGGTVGLWTGRSQLWSHPVRDGQLDFLAGTSLLIRVQATVQVGLLDERFFMYWEDTDYCFRLRRAGWHLAVAPTSKVWHLGGASTGLNSVKRKSVTFERHFSRSAVQFFRRYAQVPAVPLLRGLGWHLVKRVLKREWPQAAAIVRGGVQGWSG